MSYDYALLTITEAERAINQAGATNPKTEYIKDALYSASEEIHDRLDRMILKRDSKHWIEYHERDPAMPHILRVLHWPIDTSWGSFEIAEDSDRSYGADTLLTADTDYRIVNAGDQTSKIIRLSGGSPTSWLSGYEAIRITLKGGWAEADIPRSIRRICREFLARQYHATVNQDHAFETVNDARGTVTHYGPVMLTRPQEKALANYGDHGATTCVSFTEEDDS